jgi:hypothetical protein
MSAVDDRTLRLRESLSALDSGSALLSERLGIDRDHVAQTVTSAPLTPELTAVASELPTASERIRAARQAHEAGVDAPPVLSNLGDFGAAPAASDISTGIDGH